MEQILEQFRARIASASASGSALQIRGGGSKHWYGGTASGALLDTRAYAGVIDYEPTELVVSARCGTPLAELENLLAGNGQMLAFEPPHGGPGATVGGMFCAGLSGPRRMAAGALRDFVLGATLMDGKGDVLHFGGQVMKNVAGYDVSRMLAGSLGTLGLVLQVSLKVLPRPLAQVTLRWDMGQQQALEHLNRWAGLPLPLSASVWHDGELQLRLSGAPTALAAARERLGGEQVAPAEQPWEALREQRHAFFAPATGQALWRLALPSTTAPLALPGPQLLEWGGAQRWLLAPGDASHAALIRAQAARHGGHATLYRGGDKTVGVFQPLAPELAVIHRRIKQAFDPAGIFNPGRLLGEW